MGKQFVKIKIRSDLTNSTTEHNVLATMVDEYAITRFVEEFDKLSDTIVFGKEWTITMPNGYAFGWFETKKAALECANQLKEVAPAAELVRIHGKKRRTAAEKALVERVKTIVRQLMPIEEGVL